MTIETAPCARCPCSAVLRVHRRCAAPGREERAHCTRPMVPPCRHTGRTGEAVSEAEPVGDGVGPALVDASADLVTLPLPVSEAEGLCKREKRPRYECSHCTAVVGEGTGYCVAAAQCTTHADGCWLSDNETSFRHPPVQVPCGWHLCPERSCSVRSCRLPAFHLPVNCARSGVGSTSCRAAASAAAAEADAPRSRWMTQTGWRRQMARRTPCSLPTLAPCR
jgi:hypothetical protein